MRFIYSSTDLRAHRRGRPWPRRRCPPWSITSSPPSSTPSRLPRVREMDQIFFFFFLLFQQQENFCLFLLTHYRVSHADFFIGFCLQRKRCERVETMVMCLCVHVRRGGPLLPHVVFCGDQSVGTSHKVPGGVCRVSLATLPPPPSILFFPSFDAPAQKKRRNRKKKNSASDRHLIFTFNAAPAVLPLRASSPRLCTPDIVHRM